MKDGCERVSPRASDWASLFLSVLWCKAMEYLRERGLRSLGVAVRGIKVSLVRPIRCSLAPAMMPACLP